MNNFKFSLNEISRFFISKTVLILVFTIFEAGAQTSTLGKPGETMKTPVEKKDLDTAAFAEWVDGKEIAPTDPKAKKGPESLLWTSDAKSFGHYGMKFGSKTVSSTSHLRIGFKQPVPVGTVLTRGDVVLSILKADAPYPGNMADDSQWITGQRIVNGEISSLQPESDEMVMWVFPPGSSSRALRYSHTPKATDSVYLGILKGSAILKERLVNIAPMALATASKDNRHVNMVNDEVHDSWNTWQNTKQNDPNNAKLPVISSQNAEWIMLNWSKPVSLSGLMVFWSNCLAFEVQKYTGPDDVHPRDAAEKDWQTVQKFDGLSIGYAMGLWPNFCAFDKVLKTQALRVRITDILTGKEPGTHPHMKNRSEDGKRVWMGELFALQDLNSGKVASASVARIEADKPHPPIPVKFTLPEEGYVTLVIEDSTGRRVRNLVSETYFPKGENTVWWDGTHDLDRDLNAVKHGLYQIPARFVQPGDYNVRGLWRKKIEAVYEFPTYNTGNPPWNLRDHTGAWLANHSPPSAAVFVPYSHSPTGKPAVFLGAYITEGPDGLIWSDMNMNKKGGIKWIGGTWTAAPYMGRDTSPNADPSTSVIVASVGMVGQKGKQSEELRINALIKDAQGNVKAKQIYKDLIGGENGKYDFLVMRGVTAYEGLVACSINKHNKVMFIKVDSGEVVESRSVSDPRGLTYDDKGNLYVLSGTKLIRYTKSNNAEAETLVSSGLEDPFGITVDQDGIVYITDQGASHQVKIFADQSNIKSNKKLLAKFNGKLSGNSDSKYVQIAAIGNPGIPKAGVYDPKHMNQPVGVTVDGQGRIWVAEHDFLPKRISVWTPDGKLDNAVYGPSKYGGGGKLDPVHKDKWYYAEEGRGMMEFTLDWEKGKAELKSVLNRRDSQNRLQLPPLNRFAAPESALYRKGKRFFHNSYNSHPTSGNDFTMLFVEKDGLAAPAAAMGRAHRWPLICSEAFYSRWPEKGMWNERGEKGSKRRHNVNFFIWSDLNGDAYPQPEEVHIFTCDYIHGVTVMNDLSFTVANYNGKSYRLKPVSFTDKGIPVYDFSKKEVLAEGVLRAASSGGNQVLADDSDEVVITLGVEPFSAYSLCGLKGGKASWSYPSLWPGLHASHHAAKPDRPGQLTGTTRLLGGFVQPKGSQVGPVWAINGNMGNIYLFTRDGLFISTVFADSRLGIPWKMRTAKRGMKLGELTPGDENFWPSLNQSADGKVYIQDGSNSCILRLDGLDSLKPIPSMSLKVSPDDLKASQTYVEKLEIARQSAFGKGVMKASILKIGPKIDGSIKDWTNSEWVEIDKRGDGANFNSSSKPYNIMGAVSADSKNLYAAWDTRNKNLLENSGEVPNALFKTGGALDLMIGSNSSAASNRRKPAEGDLRLLITKVDGKTKALLYRAVVKGTPESEKIPFMSQVMTVTFDRVEDVSSHVQLAGDGQGSYEISIPLEVLGYKPSSGQRIKGDIGILRGDANLTVARTYWSNKATGITADTPSEAKLNPHLWGTIEWESK